jgi:hypothetical protein
VDTGAVFAHYTSDIDERAESHTVIQLRVVYDNIHRIGEGLLRIAAGKAKPINTTGRASSAWGQPRLSDYLRWKRAARAAVWLSSCSTTTSSNETCEITPASAGHWRPGTSWSPSSSRLISTPSPPPG